MPVEIEEVFAEMHRIGRLMHESGLVLSAHSGNISVRRGEKIYIKRRGSMLSSLKKEDVVEMSLDGASAGTFLASTEIKVHQEIYKNTSALAVVHAHSPYAIVESLTNEEITPIDEEGAYYLKKIPILTVKNAIGSEEVARQLPGLLKKYPAAIVKGHGLFATGINLESAYGLATVVESVCKLRYLARNAGVNIEQAELKEW
ncbi:MAG: aldolase [Thermoplasmata archaeon]|nr:aldolase [Thermoplasmata archaeon]